ncbi:unnamed protein product [Echinostoma caproni]|uniref:Secreted protein n=1 Tax=Echinostoma caproni TaxID=27848 RepID=A0A183AGM1_9TREM|nr:unnamed protein product [Echinostoma caproni]
MERLFEALAVCLPAINGRWHPADDVTVVDVTTVVAHVQDVIDVDARLTDLDKGNGGGVGIGCAMAHILLPMQHGISTRGYCSDPHRINESTPGST